MKTLIKNSYLLYFALIVLLVIACMKVEDPLDNDFKLRVDYNIIKTTVSMRFVDAKTGHVIGKNGNIDIKVDILGEHKDLVTDYMGEKRSSFDTNVGLLSFSVNTSSPSENNPVRFAVKVKADGYVVTSKSIYIYEEGDIETEIQLVNYNDLPSGITKAEKTIITDGSGSLISDMSLSTVNSTSTLSILSGTVLKDKNGNPLVGNLNVIMMHFDNQSEEAIAAFPGGIDASVTNESGAQEDVSFVSAGFVSVDIEDASGNRAVAIDGSLTQQIVIPADTYNPKTGAAVKAGDVIPIWSFDPNTAKWKYEKEGTVVSSGGVLKVSTKLEHLSYWNWDWKGNKCKKGMKMKFVSTDIREGTTFTLRAKLYSATTGGYLKTKYLWGRVNENIQLYNAPADMPIRIVFEGFDWAVPDPAEFVFNNMCSNEVKEITLRQNPDRKTLKISVKAILGDEGEGEILPSVCAYVWEKETNNYKFIRMIEGKAVIPGILLNSEYRVYTWLDKMYYQDFTPTQEEYSVEIVVSDDLID